ncbi:MAG: M16 family metallopeptidase [Kiloniellales bacterium]
MTVEIDTLPNGLRVVTDRMPGVESVTIGVWAAAGTRDEAPEVNGVAHLLEHMAFKGTERRRAEDIAFEIEAVGGHLNAYTAREHTAYYARVLKSDLPLAVDLLADILQHATFEEAELAREREVILQEIGQAHDTPDDVVFDRFQETAYPDQAIGRPVLGRVEVIRGMGRETVVDYRRRHYAPRRLVLAAAGNLEHRAVMDLAAAAFDSLSAEQPEAFEPARYAGGEFREARALEQAHLVLGFNGVGFHDADYFALSVLSTLLGGGMSSRLFQEVREKRGLCYAIYSFASSYVDGGLFGIYAGTGEDQVRELVAVVSDELCRLADGGTIEEVELARARAQLRSGILMSLESTAARCERLGQQMLVYGRPLGVDEIVAGIEAVDARMACAVAARLTAQRPTVAALGRVDRLEPFEAIAGRFA